MSAFDAGPEQDSRKSLRNRRTSRGTDHVRHRGTAQVKLILYISGEQPPPISDQTPDSADGFCKMGSLVQVRHFSRFAQRRPLPACRFQSTFLHSLQPETGPESGRPTGRSHRIRFGRVESLVDVFSRKAAKSARAGTFGSTKPGSGSLKESRASLKYKRPSHPTSVPLLKLFSALFPLSVKELVQDYAHRSNPLKFQHDLLCTLPFYPNADASGRRAEVVQTTLLSGQRINEFVIYPRSFAGKKVAPHDEKYRTLNHLIMVHGYGAGLGFYLKNYDAILAQDNWVVHAIDLLGYGCSLRPEFTADSLEKVEAFFHDSFAEWLALRGLHETPEKNLVLAHSMGAYLMATYGILRNPAFCRKLLMVSPGAVIKHRRKVAVPSYFARLWERNILPFTLVRKAGPLGSKLVSMWSSRRFAKLSQTESDLLHKYAYGIFQSPGSGEYMLNFLLAPGADARHPLIERGIERLKCAVLWCYGKEDWMDKRGGELCSELINTGGGSSGNCEIENAGHHIYLDNIEKFNDLVINEMAQAGGR